MIYENNIFIAFTLHTEFFLINFLVSCVCESVKGGDRGYKEKYHGVNI